MRKNINFRKSAFGQLLYKKVWEMVDAEMMLINQRIAEKVVSDFCNFLVYDWKRKDKQNEEKWKKYYEDKYKNKK